MSRLVKRVCGNTMLTINNKMQIYQACVLSTLFKNTRHHLARHCSQQGHFGKRRFAMYVSPAHPMPATMIGPYQKNGQQPNPQERALRLGTRGVASGTRPVANGTQRLVTTFQQPGELWQQTTVSGGMLPRQEHRGVRRRETSSGKRGGSGDMRGQHQQHHSQL